jgi:predicted O-methyltransferase YrrM
MRPELLPARPDCPDPGRWLAPDSDATETDVSALIGGFVLALKPDFVVETGTYHGDTTVMIGGVLKALRRGHLLSIDHDPAMTQHAEKRVLGLPVTLMTAQASQVVPPQPIDLLFIDCGLDDRIKQLRNFFPYASRRCVVLFHDSALPIDVPGVADMYADMQLAVSSGLVQPWIKLPTPRGLAITRYCS